MTTPRLRMTAAERKAMDDVIAAMRNGAAGTDEDSPVGAMLARYALDWDERFASCPVVIAP